jgi:hypothetical protein
VEGNKKMERKKTEKVVQERKNKSEEDVLRM